MSQYLKITIPASKEQHEILIAELGELQFDSFEELDETLHAFVEASIFDQPNFEITLKRYGIKEHCNIEELPNINWNEEWEKNFDPVEIDGKVYIRALFHEPIPKFEYEILINPKMAFGTGHHETTHLVITEQLQIDHRNKRILDVGTGTGILSIMAHKLGAVDITATDVDDWCIANCRENFELNHLENFQILQGTIDKLTLIGQFDIIFANINTNILLAEMPYYAGLLADHGVLVLSGFYEDDISVLIQNAHNLNLSLITQKTRNHWALLTLRKD